MVVAVYINARLSQVVGDDTVKYLLQFGLLLVGQGDAQMLVDVPLREEFEFAAQQGGIVGRQFVCARGELDFNQRIGRRAVQMGSIFTSQGLQIGGVAEIRQQQKSLRQILGIDMGDMRACRLEQARDVQKRAAVFVFGRGIHDDA